jgi:hypothetical protein
MNAVLKKEIQKLEKKIASLKKKRKSKKTTKKRIPKKPEKVEVEEEEVEEGQFITTTRKPVAKSQATVKMTALRDNIPRINIGSVGAELALRQRETILAADLERTKEEFKKQKEQRVKDQKKTEEEQKRFRAEDKVEKEKLDNLRREYDTQIGRLERRTDDLNDLIRNQAQERENLGFPAYATPREANYQNQHGRPDVRGEGEADQGGEQQGDADQGGEQQGFLFADEERVRKEAQEVEKERQEAERLAEELRKAEEEAEERRASAEATAMADEMNEQILKELEEEEARKAEELRKAKEEEEAIKAEELRKAKEEEEAIKAEELRKAKEEEEEAEEVERENDRVLKELAEEREKERKRKEEDAKKTEEARKAEKPSRVDFRMLLSDLADSSLNEELDMFGFPVETPSIATPSIATPSIATPSIATPPAPSFGLPTQQQFGGTTLKPKDTQIGSSQIPINPSIRQDELAPSSSSQGVQPTQEEKRTILFKKKYPEEFQKLSLDYPRGIPFATLNLKLNRLDSIAITKFKKEQEEALILQEEEERQRREQATAPVKKKIIHKKK